MYIVGLTGGIGSGKSTATDYFQTLGVKVIDADLASRAVVQSGSSALVEIEKRFGSKSLLESGELNRLFLREIIFNHKDDKQWLEELLHPLIRDHIKSEIRNTTKHETPYIILSSPLLFETKQDEMCHHTICIDCSVDQQLNRASKRDNLSIDDIKNVINSQIDREKRNHLANIVIINDNSLEALYSQIDNAHQQLLEAAKQ